MFFHAYVFQGLNPYIVYKHGSVALEQIFFLFSLQDTKQKDRYKMQRSFSTGIKYYGNMFVAMLSAMLRCIWIFGKYVLA